MTVGWEVAANALNAASIVLAARNSVHTWWTGILGCTVFAWVFYAARLYADVTLQCFFIGASVAGWWHWLRGCRGSHLPIRRTRKRWIAALFAAAALVAYFYGMLLARFTDAFAPFADSVVLAFSVLGQFLLVGRRVETWWCWLVVNSIAVPLFLGRDLVLTAVLYAAFWINAILALAHWRKLATA